MSSKGKEIAKGLFFVATLFIAACGKEQTVKTTPPPPAVTVEYPKQQSVTEHLDFTGKTEALQTVNVRARAEGYLQEIRFTDGAQVKEGDVLFIIDQQPYLVALQEAEATLASRQAEYQLAKKVFDRREAALNDRAVSELAVEEAKAQLDLATAAIGRAEAGVERARLNLSYTEVKSPIAGRVSRRLVDEGNLISGGENRVLATIIADNPIYVYFSISERDLQKFGAKLTRSMESKPLPALMGLSGDEGFPIEGSIDYVDNRLDAMSGTVQVRAIFQNESQSLVPGLFARIRVPLQEHPNAILVPETAMGISQAGRYLLVVDEEEKVAFRPVTIGSLEGNNRVIKTGITKTDRVVVQGAQRVQPGMIVDAIFDDRNGGSSELVTGGY